MAGQTELKAAFGGGYKKGHASLIFKVHALFIGDTVRFI
jgi:hypothetical protein